MMVNKGNLAITGTCYTWFDWKNYMEHFGDGGLKGRPVGGLLDPPWAMKCRWMPLAMAACMGTSVEFQKIHEIS